MKKYFITLILLLFLVPSVVDAGCRWTTSGNYYCASTPQALDTALRLYRQGDFVSIAAMRDLGAITTFNAGVCVKMLDSHYHGYVLVRIPANSRGIGNIYFTSPGALYEHRSSKTFRSHR